MRPSILAIVGPTAVGKSAVAERLALALGGEVVSADSMQVYRGMDVGTAKTPPRDRLVPHHCLDLVDPGEPYSAALYQRDARTAIADIAGRGLLPVVAGGTGLYVRAALDEMSFPAGAINGALRRDLERRLEEAGPEAMHAELATTDPASASLIHPHNVKRVLRALEMASQGTSYASQAAGFARRRLHYPDTVFVGLTMERAALYERIDARVDAMIGAGLIDEVRALLARGLRETLTAAQAIGYKELVAVIDGDDTLEAAVLAVKQASRRYAKRQLSWFRADPRVTWLDVTGLSADETTAAALELVESAAHQGPDEEGSAM